MIKPAHSRFEYAQTLMTEYAGSGKDIAFQREADLVTLAGSPKFKDIPISGPPTLPYKSHVPIAMEYVLLDPTNGLDISLLSCGLYNHPKALSSALPRYNLQYSIEQESKRRRIPAAASLAIVEHVIGRGDTSGATMLLGGIEYRQADHGDNIFSHYSALLIPTFLESSIEAARHTRRNLLESDPHTAEVQQGNPFWFVHDYIDTETASRAVTFSLLQHARKIRSQ